MSVHVDPEPLQRLEHKERLLRERLKQTNAKQWDLLQQEAQIKNEIYLLETQRANLLQK